MRHKLFLKSEATPWPRDTKAIDSIMRSRREHIVGETDCAFLQEAVRAGEVIEHILFADLSSERLIVAPGAAPSVAGLMLAANTHLIRALVKHSSQVEILIRGKVLPLIRQARFRGLMCVASALSDTSQFEVHLLLSGPLSLFRRARLYGRFLVEILPFLPNTDRYRMTIVVPNNQRTIHWTIESGDPIKPAVASSEFDSQIERNFSVDFRKATTDFDLIREPQPISVGKKLIFPDFAIKHRTDFSKKWFLEVVGFWTSSYLREKAENLRHADIKNVILCVDRRLGSEAGDWPSTAEIVWFDRRIKADDVLRIIGYLQKT